MGLTIGEKPIFTGDKVITGSLTIGADAILQREAANVLAQRNGASPQIFRNYNSWTDASNWERAEIGWNVGPGANVFGVVVGSGGSGASRALAIGTLSSSSGAIRFYQQGTHRWEINAAAFQSIANYNIFIGQSALATTATQGFLGVNSCAGPPTGVPASIPTGQIPLVWDSVNFKLYAYTGGAWKSSAAFA